MKHTKEQRTKQALFVADQIAYMLRNDLHANNRLERIAELVDCECDLPALLRIKDAAKGALERLEHSQPDPGSATDRVAKKLRAALSEVE